MQIYGPCTKPLKINELMGYERKQVGEIVTRKESFLHSSATTNDRGPSKTGSGGLNRLISGSAGRRDVAISAALLLPHFL